MTVQILRLVICSWINDPNNAPGMYLMPSNNQQTPNDILILMNTYGGNNIK